MASQSEMMRRQRALAEFGDFVLDHEELDDILTEGCRLIAEALGADLAKVMEIERDRNTACVRAGVGWQPGVVGHTRVTLSKGSSEAYAIETAQPVICNDIGHERRFTFPAFLRDHGVIALVNVPIFLPGRKAWGVLQVDARRPRAFDREDIEFLKTYAMVLGPVIDRIRVAAERAQALSGLGDRENRLRRVLDGMGEGFTLLAPDFTILEHNRQALHLDGRSPADVIGRSYWEVYPGSAGSEAGALLAKAMAERWPISVEHLHTDEDGGLRWLEMRAYPTEDGSLALFSRDVTGRREAADALRESEERLRLAIAIGELASWDWDLRSGAISWNDRHYLLQGYAVGEVRPSFDRWIERVHPEDRETAVALIERARDERTTYAHEFRSIHPDGQIRWCSARGRFFYDDRGSPYRMVGVMEDVTDRTLTEQKLRENEEGLRAILESALDYAIFTTDPAGYIQTWSPGAEAVFGWSAEEAIGQDLAVTFTPEDRQSHVPENEMAQAREQGVAPNIRWHVRKDGRRVFIEGSTRPLESGGTTNGGFLKVGKDVTERKQWEERQQVLVAELQHRTRNLIAVVRSMADKTMKRMGSLEDFRRAFRDRLEALARVQGLLSRLEEHDRVPFDALIRTELMALGVLDSAGDRVTLDGPEGVRLRSSTVQTLAMALHELATNAAKYGAFAQPDGRLAVSWRLEPARDDGKPWLHIDWRESGVAMPEPGAAPVGSGQGRELIERALPYQLQARTTYAMGADGVRCTISIPVSASTAQKEDRP